MIKLFNRVFWNIVLARLPGPWWADRPLLIILEDDHAAETR